MKKLTATMAFVLLAFTFAQSQSIDSVEKTDSQWKGKKVGILGDSMTQKWKKAPERMVYWEYLQEMLGFESYVYGISGHRWTQVYAQAEKLKAEHGDEVDAITIFAGTNDYNHNVPLGSFYEETAQETNFNGTMTVRKYRTLVETDETFCGRINKVMSYLKTNFPDQQIIIMTPIHRGFATFNEKNVQPEERFSNDLGLYQEDYVNVLREAASVWAVPLIDLYSISGLYPVNDSFVKYYMNGETDRLHPNTAGNYRLAKTIKYQLLCLPATFNE